VIDPVRAVRTACRRSACTPVPGRSLERSSLPRRRAGSRTPVQCASGSTGGASLCVAAGGSGRRGRLTRAFGALLRPVAGLRGAEREWSTPSGADQPATLTSLSSCKEDPDPGPTELAARIEPWGDGSQEPQTPCRPSRPSIPMTAALSSCRFPRSQEVSGNKRQ